MKKQLTDEMILEGLSKSPIPMLIIGIVTLIIGIMICMVIKKKWRSEHERRYLYVAGPFFIFGVLLTCLGTNKLLQKPLTMDSFAVKKCEIIDMYKWATNPYSADKDYKYYIVCDDHEGAIKVTYHEYYREYELGDYMYLVVKADDVDYLYYKYWEDEYEYIGNKLIP